LVVVVQVIQHKILQMWVLVVQHHPYFQSLQQVVAVVQVILVLLQQVIQVVLAVAVVTV